MPDYAETTIRIGADTGLAEAALARVSAGFDAMQSRTMPGLQRAFGTTSRYAMQMTGVMSSMGIGAQALTGPLGAVAYGLGAIHPAFLAVAAAGGLVAGMFLRQKEEAENALASITKYHGAIQELSKSFTHMGERAREQARLDNQRIAAQIKLIEEEQRMADLGYIRANLMDRLTATTIVFDKSLSTLTGTFKRVTIASEEQAQRIRELMDEYNRLKGSLVMFGEAEAAFTTTVVGHRNLALAASIAENEAMLKLLETTEYAVPRMIELHRERAEVMKLGADDFVKTEKRAFDKATHYVMVYESAVSASLRREMNLRKAIGAGIIALTTDIIAAELEQIAKEAVVKALIAGGDALMGRPGAAAAALKYAAAAAAAATGAAIVRSFGEQQVSGIGGPGGAERVGEGTVSMERVGEGTVSMERGRTVMSQGPITLNYSAIMTIQGNVYDTSDLRVLWNQWNLDQLRTAGIDAAKRAKG